MKNVKSRECSQSFESGAINSRIAPVATGLIAEFYPTLSNESDDLFVFVHHAGCVTHKQHRRTGKPRIVLFCRTQRFGTEVATGIRNMSAMLSVFQEPGCATSIDAA